MLARLAPRTERSRVLREARLRTRSLTEFDGVLTSEEARAAAARVLAEGWPLSPTGLEGYATCPLRYFFSDVLRLRPLEEPAEILELDALDRGRAMHDILHAFVEAVGEERFDVRHRTELDAIADRVLADLEARGRTGAALLWTAHRQAILDDLEGWFARELADPGPYTKRRLEVLFGDPEPVRVSAGGLELRLRGRIDRLDYDDKRFRVVDYKSGRALKGGDGSLAGGTTLQLPLYLLAGAQLVGLDPADGEAAYHYFSRGDFKRVVFTGEHLTARRGELDNLLERIARGISEGDFHAEPDDNACRFCDFDGLCDVGRKRIRERKGADQRITSFAEMREIK
jgi:ATP-dependent helicase/DNAse subunit B